MNISEAGRKRTDELVDALAHEAGLVDAKHHVRGDAFAKSGARQHTERNEHGTPADVAEHVAVDTFLEVIAHGAEHWAPAKAAWLAEGGAEVAGIVWLGREAIGALIDAEEKGIAISAAFDNDAVSCALAGNLAFAPAFAALEQHARPGVTKGTTKLTIALQDPRSPIKQVLQARADEGYLVAERAAQATKDVAPPLRAKAIASWYVANGYVDRLKADIAFAKGVEYHAFVTDSSARGLYGLNAEAERKKVLDRVPLERPCMVQP
ncbi:MAG: hypothetical protein U0270_13575 [Labilithrix sp.]